MPSVRFALDGAHSVDDLLERICRGRTVFAPSRGAAGRLRVERADRWDPSRHTLGDFRPTLPLKALLFPPREHLGPLRGPEPALGDGERIAVGVKACDLSSLRVHDFVFRDAPPADPRYAAMRERTILVGADCTDCLDACFCTSCGLRPHPETGYDVNLARTSRGIVVEVGTERGRELAEEAGGLLGPVPAPLAAALEEERAAMADRVSAQAEAAGLPAGTDLAACVAGAMESPLWADFAADCVECGACNFVCCTCHCFALADGPDRAGAAARCKLWDSCLYAGFAKVAGGGTPRERRAERLRNRFDKKFVYFPEVLGTLGCDGCGRCTEACAGRIDVRAVLKRAIDEREPVSAGPG